MSILLLRGVGLLNFRSFSFKRRFCNEKFIYMDSVNMLVDLPFGIAGSYDRAKG
jgi:hypothetical protein